MKWDEVFRSEMERKEVRGQMRVQQTVRASPNSYGDDFPEATSVSVVDSVGILTISTFYLQSRHAAMQDKLQYFCNTLGRRFSAGGDYNSKHSD
jgi:hypothetical protein